MSEQTQYELAEELGFAHKVNDDWGNITTREAGSLIRAAIEKTEKPNDLRQIAVGDSIPTAFFLFYTYHKSKKVKKVIDKLSN